MFSTTLPDSAFFNDEAPELKNNAVLFANTRTKYYYPEHKTPYLFIANFLNKGKYIANGAEIEVSDKCFYFLNANDKLEINITKNIPVQTFLILFNQDFIEGSFNYFSQSDEKLLTTSLETQKSEIVFPTVPFSYNESILKKVHILSKLNLLKEDLDDLLFDLLLDLSVLHNSTRQRLKQIQAVKKTTKEEIYRRIFMAIEMMNAHVIEKASLDVIAKTVCMNKFHFLARFKSITGITPHQYFIQLKLQKAYELLQTRQYSVSEVCHTLGFESIGSFSNLFKRKFHCAPSQIPNFR